MSLSSCLKKAGNTFNQREKFALISSADKFVSGGMARGDAEMAAVQAALDEALADHQEVIDAVFAELPSLKERFSDEKLPVRQDQSAPNVNGGPAVKVADWVAQRIKSKQAFKSAELFKQADAAYGGTQGEGRYTPKDAYDAMELGVNKAIEGSLTLNPGGKVGAAQARQTVADLGEMLAQLPTQTKRTAEMDEFQQFSTPPTYAYVVNWVANIRKGEQALEPSAGIGGLAVFAKNAGARVAVNELSARRAALLREMGFDQVFTENAEQLNNVLQDDIKPTVIIMNPPFSASAGRMQGKRDTKTGAGHIEQALKRLQPGGRLVAIVGEGMAADRPAFTTWWNGIKKQYDVRANIGVDGKGYAKYGTSFSNQILVIDKTGPTKGAPVTGKVSDIADTLPLLEGIRNDRQEDNGQGGGAQPAAAKPVGQKTAATGGSVVDGAARPARGKPDAVGDGRSGDIFTQAEQPVSGKPDGANSTGRTGSGNGNAGKSGRAGGVAGGTDGRADSSNDPFGDVSTSSPSERPVAGSQLDVQIHQQESNSSDNPLTDAVFENYRPQRMHIPGAKAHPAKLVQSAAMASVLPPEPTYKPNLPATIATQGKISLVGLEPVVYAGQAHAQFLQNGERKGYFIGDGTGVGKGREISGIIMDNWNSGRRKALWISKSGGLINDARRDWRDIGGSGEDIFDLGKIKAGDKIPGSKGILFTTYATLRSQEKKQANEKGEKQGKLRVDQIVEWLGADYDGVIAFDEAHSMGNAVPMKAKRGVKPVSQQALRGIELQEKLPKARVVYVSATGATEVHNLGYATRLGIWGPGTPFPTVNAFINSIEEGGLAAMELVSRDLKAMGVYIARSLSYDGVTYSRLEHPLTPIQNDIYNELARAWQGVLKNVDEALKLTNQHKDRNAKSAALAAFWGSHQRFFNQIITSMQMPSVIEQVQKDIEAGNAIVMQFVNTNEATQTRQLASMEEGDNLEDLDLTPRENLIQYVQNSFPIQQYELYADDNGNERSRPVVDSQGNPVFNKDAIAERDRIIGNLENIRVPDGPLEMIVNHFTPSKVAEVTGRKQRVVRVMENGEEKTIVQKRGKSAAASDAAAFMADQKSILMFSDAGGTGYSFHADNTKKNKRRRMHYLIQPGWRADNAVQGFGRTHRTNQASEPHYYLVTTNLKAQKRFISSIARRLDQLGALTKGQRQTGSQGLFSAKDNLESQYAEDAVYMLFRELHQGVVPGLPFVDTMNSLGFDPGSMLDKNGNLNEDKIPDVPKFLNRLLSLTTDMQDTVFDAFVTRLEANVEEAIRRGTLDFGMETLRAKGITVRHEDRVRKDEATGAETHYVELELTHDTIFKEFGKAGKDTKFLKNKVSGKVWVVEKSGTMTKTNGAVVDRYYFDGTGSKTVAELDEDKFETLTRAEAEALWDAENAARPKTWTELTHMLTGSLLPIWDRLKGTIRVARAQTDDGRRVLGRIIHPSGLAETLKNLGATSSMAKTSPAEVMRAVLDDGKIGLLSNGWRVKRSRVSSENRIEVLTGSWMQPATMTELVNYGMIIERIAFQERAFVPVGAKGPAVLEKLLKVRELVDLLRKGESETALSRATITSRAASQVDRAGMQRTDLNAVAGLFRAKFKTAPLIHVNQSVNEAPAELLKDIRKLGGEHDTAGAWHDGEIYLFADNIRNPEHASWVVLHELTHNGLRGMFGSDINPVMMSIYMNSAEVRKAAGVQLQRNPKLSTVAATEEVLANMGADGIPQSVWRQLIAGIRRLLRKMGVTLELTDNDVRDLVSRALRFNKTPSDGVDIVSGTALSEADQTQTQAFRKWFGDSKVVDSDGKPIVVYHGTNAKFTEFNESGEAFYGSGIYFSGSKSAAKEFGSYKDDGKVRVMPVYLSLQRPYIFDAPAAFAEPSNVTLAKELFKGRELRSVLKILESENWQNPTTEFKDKLEGMGHDGMIVMVPGEPTEYIAFHPEQIKSAIGNNGQFDAGNSDIRYSRNSIDDEPRVGAPFMVYRAASEEQLGNRNAGNAVAVARFLAGSEDHESPISTKATAIHAYRVTVTEPFGKYEGLYGGKRGARKEVGKAERGGEVSYSFPAGGKWEAEHVGHITLPDAREFLGKNYMAWRFEDLDAGRAAGAIRAMFEPGNTALSRTAGGTGTSAVPNKTGVIDTLFRIPTQLLGIDKLTSKTYDVLLERLGALVPEKVKAGVVADYGIPEAVIDRRVLMGANVRRGLRTAQGFIDNMQDMTRAESRIAYEWMTSEHPDEKAAEELPEESRAVLSQMKALVSSLGKEAVRLGQLSAETYERSPTSYLHRSYMKYETELTPQQKAQRARSTRILGDQYKGRGMTAGVPMSRIQNTAPDWWKRKLQAGKADKALKGEKFIRLERRANRGDGVAVLPGMEDTGQLGKLLEVRYWPADEKVPDRYGAWDRDEGGVWEVRNVKGDQAIMWRDFTSDEQDRMGRIDEVRYAVAQTLHKMVHDIEAGRYLEYLANRFAQPKADGLNVVNASERLMDTFKDGEWVKVPETEIPGTAVKTYGKLAGLYLPGPIWNDVRQVMNRNVQPFGEAYNTILKAWKISKTALSPAVHMNNVMANIVMADWHDVRATDLVRALTVMVRDTPENKKLLDAFDDAGGKHGLFTLSEIQREQLAPLLEQLQKDVAAAGGSGIINAASVLQAVLHGGTMGDRFRAAAAAAADSKATAAVKKMGGMALDLYEAEDTVFRLAAYLKSKAEGRSDSEAGKFARKSFLDYEINAPWIQLMRSTFFPFVSFVYRAVPMLLETIARKPWKLFKLAAFLGGLNALGYALSGGDEDKERKLLPEEKRGRVLGYHGKLPFTDKRVSIGVAPKLIRMPWNDNNGSPVFLDIRRFIPVGDILDVEQTHGSLPLLPAMMPGGPLAVMGELIFNKSMFTGKEITKPDTDTGGELVSKIFDHMFKAFAPNLPYYSFGVLPETYSAQAITNAGKGKTDVFGREHSLPSALASSIGVKVAGYPADAAKRGLMLEHDAAARDIGENISKLKREYQQHGMTREEFDAKVKVQIDKRRKIDNETRGRLN